MLRGAVKYAGSGPRLSSAVSSSSQRSGITRPPSCADTDRPKVLITGRSSSVSPHLFFPAVSFRSIKVEHTFLVFHLLLCRYRRARSARGGARQVAEVRGVSMSSYFKCCVSSVTALSPMTTLASRTQETLREGQRDPIRYPETPQPRLPQRCVFQYHRPCGVLPPQQQQQHKHTQSCVLCRLGTSRFKSVRRGRLLLTSVHACPP